MFVSVRSPIRYFLSTTLNNNPCTVSTTTSQSQSKWNQETTSELKTSHIQGPICWGEGLGGFVFYFNNSVKCPCNVIHDSVTLIFTFLIIIIITLPLIFWPPESPSIWAPGRVDSNPPPVQLLLSVVTSLNIRQSFYDHGIHGCKMSEGVFHRTSDFSCMKIENRMHCSSCDQWTARFGQSQTENVAFLMIFPSATAVLWP